MEDMQTNAIMYENYIYSHGKFETDFNSELDYAQPLGICDKNGNELFNHDTLYVVLNGTYKGCNWYVKCSAEILLDKLYGLTMSFYDGCAYSEKDKIENFDTFIKRIRYRREEVSASRGLGFVYNIKNENKKPCIFISHFETTLSGFEINESHDIFFHQRWMPARIKSCGNSVIYVRPLETQDKVGELKDKAYYSRIGLTFTKEDVILLEDIKRKCDITKMLQIPKTKEIVDLVNKWLNYEDTHFGTNEDIERSKFLKTLPPWWQAVVVVYWENSSLLKFAKFFGVTQYTARIIIAEINKLKIY